MAPEVSVRPLRDALELQGLLTLILDRISRSSENFQYRLVGTAAALLQGVDLPTVDIDILVTRRADVDAFAASLVGYPCLWPPSWLGEERQYFTHFAVSGIDTGASTVEVPVEADTFECLGSGPWDH